MTDRDIVVKVIAQGMDPKACLAGELGGDELVTIGAGPDKGDFTSVPERSEKAVKHHVDEEESDVDKLMKTGRVFSQAKAEELAGTAPCAT